MRYSAGEMVVVVVVVKIGIVSGISALFVERKMGGDNSKRTEGGKRMRERKSSTSSIAL